MIMFRTHTCGELTVKEAGKKVTLAGWVHRRRDHGGLIFIDLRDRYGLTQITFDPNYSPDAWKIAETFRAEYVVKVTGEVKQRPATMVNKQLSTGEIEVVINDAEILNSSETPPFEILNRYEEALATKNTQVNEEMRLKYRFLDLRRERLQENLILRHQMIEHIRQYMGSRDFLEIQTPILTASTPEGARDFLVPSRLHPGKFYALPQSPQQYKQLLMVAGLDKYFQIAPCMRDEDARAFRSPGEFYQLDVEMSFKTQDQLFAEMEPLFIELTEKFTSFKVWQKPFPRIPFDVAVNTYGNDKPDLRFGCELHDVTALVKDSKFEVFKAAPVVKGIAVIGGDKMSRKDLEELTEVAKKFMAKGLAWAKIKNNQTFDSPIAKFLSEAEIKSLIKDFKAKAGDLLLFVADELKIVNKSLGEVRVMVADKLELRDMSVMAWCWIVDFPMYEFNEEQQKLDFAHNPFSMPQGGLEALNTHDPLAIKAFQYDIVCDGVEISSGAVRNHRPDIMYKAFELVGYDRSVVDKRFGHMIQAFKYGAPPHCGFAPGIESLLYVLTREPNIREVMAFPKSGRAEDLMMGAPSDVDDKQLKELHIKLDLNS